MDDLPDNFFVSVSWKTEKDSPRENFSVLEVEKRKDPVSIGEDFEIERIVSVFTIKGFFETREEAELSFQTMGVETVPPSLGEISEFAWKPVDLEDIMKVSERAFWLKFRPKGVSFL